MYFNPTAATIQDDYKRSHPHPLAEHIPTPARPPSSSLANESRLGYGLFFLFSSKPLKEVWCSARDCRIGLATYLKERPSWLWRREATLIGQ